MTAGTLERLALGTPTPAAVPGCLTIQSVYAAHFGYVWRCLRGLGVPQPALDDAAQDVFLVVQRKLPSFDGVDAQVTTWLYAIALRVARRYRAHWAREAHELSSLSPDEPDAAPTPAEAASQDASDVHTELEHAERLTLARKALDALDADKREAFVLACIEQRPAPEVAQLIGVPLNTVYSRIRAARRLFAAEIARLESTRGRRSR